MNANEFADRKNRNKKRLKLLCGGWQSILREVSLSNANAREQLLDVLGPSYTQKIDALPNLEPLLKKVRGTGGKDNRQCAPNALAEILYDFIISGRPDLEQRARKLVDGTLNCNDESRKLKSHSLKTSKQKN